MKPVDITSGLNTTSSQRQIRRSLLRAGPAICLTALIPTSTGLTQELEPAPDNDTSRFEPDTAPGQPALTLDGLSFEGPTGAMGMDAHHSEVISFESGLMGSSECERWGFMPGKYRAWRENGRIRFVARLISQQYGAIDWAGEIVHSQVKAQYHWRKERLFWTLKNSYWFKGAARS